MASDCPVCGAEVEHVRREQGSDDSDRAETASTAQTTLEMAALCDGEPADRWDRICHRASVEQHGDQHVPALDTFYHHFGGKE